jgi:hypothetical protein
MMQNGQIVIGYAYNGGGNTVKFAVYSTAGTFVATYTVATSNSSGSIVRMCVLGNGKLVIAWGDSSNNIKFAVYSTSYTLLTSGTTQALFSISPSSPNSTGEGFDIAALSDIDRFVLSYSNGGQTCSIVINDTLGNVYNAGITGNGNYNSNKVCALASGGYVLLQQYNSASTGTFVTPYYKNSANTYAQATNFSLIGDNQNLGYTNPISMTPQGVGLAYIPQASTSGQLYTVDLGERSGTGLVAMSNAGTTSQGAVTTLASGALVAVRMDINAGQYYVYVYSPTGTSQHLANAISGLDQNASTPIPTLAPTFDNAFICAYRNSSGYPIFFVGSTVATSYSTSIIAGTTVPNAPGYLPSQANGYIFKGVAVTTATASGSGVVQNVGQAQLNSSYPSGTSYQAFDSTGSLVLGTKGTITGRNVNMTGTS